MAQCIAVLPWLLPPCTDDHLYAMAASDLIPGYCDDPGPASVVRRAWWRWCAINGSDTWWMEGFKVQQQWVHCQREWQEELYESWGLISHAHMLDNGMDQVQDILCLAILVVLVLVVYSAWRKE